MGFYILVKRNNELIGYLSPKQQKKEFDNKITGIVVLSKEKYNQWNISGEHIFSDIGYMDSYENDTIGEELLLYKSKTNNINQKYKIIGSNIYSSGRLLTLKNNIVLVGGKGLSNLQFEVALEHPNPVAMMEYVDKILSIYTFNFLKNKVKNLVKYAYINGIHKNTFLIKSNKLSSDENIHLSLKYRYPAYFGRIMYDYFDDSKLKEILHYNTEDVNEKITEEIDVESRYGICGPVDGIDHTGYIRKDVWILHVWGINLETKNTADYHNIVINGNINTEKYYERCIELYATIKKAAYEINKITNKKVKIIMPGIGQGAFLSSIKDKGVAIRLHTESINNTFEKNNVYTVYYTDISKTLSKSGVIPWNNLFNIPKENEEEIVLMVNAWDNRSFIGNGGTQDNSIDGYIVSGSGPGKNFLNSSYLHNVFFSEHLNNEKDWVRL